MLVLLVGFQHGTRLSYRKLAIGIAFAVLLLSMNISAIAMTPNDDLFGYNFSPDRLPANTAGLEASYAMSTTGVTLSCSQGGWVGTVNTLRVSAGSPDEWLLQGFVGLGCNGSTEVWNIQYAYFDNNNNYYSGNLGTLSISSYSSLSGNILIYYTGSVWTLQVYVSQTSHTYSYNYPSNGGTKADASNNDWTAVETDYQQVGLSFSSSFSWTVNAPHFRVSGAWQNWNIAGSNYKELDMYALYQPSKSGNTIGVWPSSTRGVTVYVGQSYNDTEEMTWCISGVCPMLPAP